MDSLRVGEKISSIKGDLFAKFHSEKCPFDLILDISANKCWVVLVFCKFSELADEEKELLVQKEEEFSKIGCSFYTCTHENSIESGSKAFSILISPDVPDEKGRTMVMISSEGDRFLRFLKFSDFLMKDVLP